MGNAYQVSNPDLIYHCTETKKEEKAFDIVDIVKKYLKENDFDGLCSAECGCEIEDLRLCGECLCNCTPGNKYYFNIDSVVCKECKSTSCIKENSCWCIREE